MHSARVLFLLPWCRRARLLLQMGLGVLTSKGDLLSAAPRSRQESHAEDGKLSLVQGLGVF